MLLIKSNITLLVKKRESCYLAIRREANPYNEALWGRSYSKDSREKDGEKKMTEQKEGR